MFSISTASCSSPRPATSKASLPSVSRTCSATLPSASFCSRSQIRRLVTLSPTRPASGLSLTEKVMDRVGGSIGWAASASVTFGAQSVSATVAWVSPAMATISPASALSIGCRSRPRKARILVARPVSSWLPSMPSALIAMLGVRRPDWIRPVRIRPRKGLASKVVASMRKGSSALSTFGAGT